MQSYALGAVPPSATIDTHRKRPPSSTVKQYFFVHLIMPKRFLTSLFKVDLLLYLRKRR